MDDPKQHVIDSLKQATNILVTVRKNPTIDQLSACIALTLIVNEVGKHGTAVFSGQVPPMLSYLKPDKTLERNTDSLQDFIISLDKAKADKLRYKVEDTVVKIFITPYRTSLSNKDLEFGQGDFNVDVVVALGVHDQADVDEAITAHGRILHDATVISINNDNEANKDLGSVSWVDPNVSGLSEMIFSIANSLGKEDAIDNQAATALLTGIVAETERFGNLKTTPETMEIAAKLLIAGANQELVANAMSESSKPKPPVNNSDNNSPGTGNSGESHDIPQDTSGNNGGTYGSSDNSGLPTVLNPVEQKNPDELDIEHLSGYTGNTGPTEPTPYSAQSNNTDSNSSMAQGLQLEDTPFGAPQPEDRPSGESQQAVPAIIDLPSAQPNSGDKPSFSQPPLGTNVVDAALPSPGKEEQSPVEDQAALDYLKGRKVENNMRGRIEPLSDQGHYLEGLPQHEDDNTKFALTPPTLGGTLTASMGSDHDTPPTDAMQNQSAVLPLLSHDKPGMPQDASQTAKPEPATPLITPLVQQPEPDSVQAETAKTAIVSPTAAGHQTLAQLEKQLHSNHPARVAGNEGKPASQPPAGAMDMPKPAAPTVVLPSPLIETLPAANQSSASTPPPVPPPLPSMPS
jgi:hypothetical protein